MNVDPWQVLTGAGMDLLLGDPRWFPHPIRGLGWWIGKLETAWRATGLPLRWAGCGFWLSTVGSAIVVVWITLPWATVFWIWVLLAWRDLDVEATRVLRALDRSDLGGARAALAMIVGRDTASLDEPEILRATVETVAENLSDAVIAPLFYLALAGPVGMAAYKAINTLDSMVGYRNTRYREFGWASARLDDVANYLPARLTALLVWLCAWLPRFDAGRCWRVIWRDGASQPSPNAGYPEAAVAGAVGIRLGGLNTYAGVPSRKPYLGDPILPLDRQAFQRARILLYAAGASMVALVCAVRA